MRLKAQTHTDGTRLLQQLFWVNQLGESLPETTLWAHRARPRSRESGGFAEHHFELPFEVSERLFGLTKNSHLSIYLVLAAALSLLLYRYTGDEEMLIGSPPYSPNGTDGAGGGLVPLRLRLRAGAGFKTHLLETRRRILEAYSNQEYPFGSLPGLSAAAHENDDFPPVRVALSLRNIHGEDGARAQSRELDFSFVARQDRLSGRVTYDANLFERSAIESLTDHYTNILRGVVRDFNVGVDEVGMLTEREERRCLVEFNRRVEPDLPGGPAQGIAHRIFEAQAKKTPGRIAVACEGRSLTYGELNARANRVAHSLRELGVGPEVIVPVLAERGVELLISMLALFKSGGVYLPLDPLQPARRLSQLIGRSGCALLLAGEGMRATLDAALNQLPDESRPAAAFVGELLTREQPDADLPCSTSASNLAYVIYTSGSTGVPKGAMVEHGGMLNHLRSKIEEFRLDGRDALAQTAPQGFDISIWQLFAALLVGGRVHIASDEIVRDPTLLLEWLEREAVSVLEVVPSQLRALLQTIEVAGAGEWKLPALRLLFVTGEALPPELSRKWLDLYPQTPLVNAYGPTECSDDVTHYCIGEPPPAEAVSTPIGRPIVNTQIYILDRRLRPVPPGVAGELFVGGSGVGRGYLRDAARTAEVFIPHPFSTEPGARLYRTGDLAFHLPDGNIQFINRVDYQVKVRGFRIETDEIVASLVEHTGVREAVVVATDGPPDEKRLVAYVVAEREQDLTHGHLRDFLKGRLPEYMIPSAFVMLERLPLGPNGKVDRRALSRLAAVAQEKAESFVRPRTPVEEALAGIFAETLRIERVGAHDNFFELGGNSLLAIQVINRIRARFQTAVPLRVLFESPAIGELAERVGPQFVKDCSGEEEALGRAD